MMSFDLDLVTIVKAWTDFSASIGTPVHEKWTPLTKCVRS
jgi:hypothetical protein